MAGGLLCSATGILRPSLTRDGGFAVLMQKEMRVCTEVRVPTIGLEESAPIRESDARR